MIRLLAGDCRSVLKTLPDGSVHCIVTSPPYFGLRSYLPAGHPDKAMEIGSEPTPDAYVATMVSVFREIRRVLRDDGTVWLNLGDSYASGGRATYRSGASDNKGHLIQNDLPRPVDAPGIKAKDLLMIPAQVALALRADGWYLRSDTIWHKPNPMPESCLDRPTSSHEHVFLLTKKAAYFYDAEAVREDTVVEKGNARTFRGGGAYTQGRAFHNDTPVERDSVGNVPNEDGTRNLRNVWTIATQPYSGAHFATMPTALVETCIKAGTSEGGCCAACGSPIKRIITKGEPDRAHQAASGGNANGEYFGLSTKGHDAHGVQNASDVKRRILEGMRHRISTWQATCLCAAPVVPCVVLDPFSGAGTVALTADRLGRDAIGIDLNPSYGIMATNRVTNDAPLFAQVSTD